MANDIDMLKNIVELEDLGFTEQAGALGDLFNYIYGWGESKYKTIEQFEKAKKDYQERYGFLDNYV